MHYSPRLYKSLQQLYEEKEFGDSFIDDNSYLKSASVEAEIMWKQNLNQLTSIKFIIVGEAPLWGDKKNYIYNPNRHNTQFFTRNDLGKVLGVSITNKVEFIEQCIQIGLLFIDAFPFALNKRFTKLNFQTMLEYDYRYLYEKTADSFFLNKLQTISSKCTTQTKVAFRYSRTKYYLNDLIERHFIQSNILQSINSPIITLSKQGGLINRMALSRFLTE